MAETISDLQYITTCAEIINFVMSNRSALTKVPGGAALLMVGAMHMAMATTENDERGQQYMDIVKAVDDEARKHLDVLKTVEAEIKEEMSSEATKDADQGSTN